MKTFKDTPKWLPYLVGGRDEATTESLPIELRSCYVEEEGGEIFGAAGKMLRRQSAWQPGSMAVYFGLKRARHFCPLVYSEPPSQAKGVAVSHIKQRRSFQRIAAALPRLTAL